MHREVHVTVKELAGRNYVDRCTGNNRSYHVSGTMCHKLQMTFTATVSYFDDAILKIS